MKKTLLSLMALSFVCTGLVQAQSPPANAPRICLVDLQRVFDEYDKYQALKKSFEAEAAQMEATLKAKGERLQQQQKEAQKLEPGGASFEAAEKAILQARGDFEAYKAASQRQLARRDSEALKAIYSEVSVAVGQFASAYKMDFVMKYNSKKLSDATNDQETFNAMNGPFIYTNDNYDITNRIVTHLNKQYQQQSGNRSAVRPVSNTRTRQ